MIKPLPGKNIFIFGFHGRNNFGDDLFLRITLDDISSRCKNSLVYVSAPRGSYVDKYGTQNKILGVIPSRFLGTPAATLISAIYMYFSEEVIFSSGSIFRRNHFWVIWIALLLRRVIGRRKGISIKNVSIGPFSSKVDAFFVSKIVEMADSVSFRDAISATRIRDSINLKCPVEGDLVVNWLASKSSRPAIGSLSPRRATNDDTFNILLNFCDHENSTSSREEIASFVNYVRELVARIAESRSGRLVVTIIAMDKSEIADGRLLMRICNALNSLRPDKISLQVLLYSGVVEFGAELDSSVCASNRISSESVFFLLKNTDISIVSRLHLAIASIAMGSPSIVLGYGEKHRSVKLYNQGHTAPFFITEIDNLDKSGIEEFLDETGF